MIAMDWRASWKFWQDARDMLTRRGDLMKLGLALRPRFNAGHVLRKKPHIGGHGGWPLHKR